MGFRDCFRQGSLEGVLQWLLEGRRVLRRVLRRGSKTGLSRRYLEGRNASFESMTPGSCNKKLLRRVLNCFLEGTAS